MLADIQLASGDRLIVSHISVDDQIEAKVFPANGTSSTKIRLTAGEANDLCSAIHGALHIIVFSETL